MPIPIVIEKNGQVEQTYDIFSRLLKDRIIFLHGQVDDDSASHLVAQLLFLSCEDPKKDIHFYINSPGGSVTAGMSIYDTMQYVPCDVATYCIGQCASMGAMLLTAGHKGKRYCLPNSRVMIHQPLETIEKGTDRDNFMSATEAKEFGLVDHIVERMPALPETAPGRNA